MAYWGSYLRGLEQMMWDAYDRAEWLHRFFGFLSDAHIKHLQGLEADGRVVRNDDGILGHCNGLPQPDFDGTHVRLVDCWGRGDAQEFALVSPEVHEEFLLAHQVPILEWFPRLSASLLELPPPSTSSLVAGLCPRLSGSLTQDVHGNVQLSGTGALGDGLTTLLSGEFQKRGAEKIRARADTLSYLQRSFPQQSEVDRREALEVGRFAAQQAMSGNLDGSITIVRDSTTPYKVHYERVDLGAVAGKTRTMPDAFINEAANHVTPAFVEYALPLVGDLAPMTDLQRAMVPKVALQ